MARFLGWSDGSVEPITLEQVLVQARIDDDEGASTGDYIQTVVIPAARQAAEARTGAAIRKGSYRDTLLSLPPRGFTLEMGAAYAITSIEIDGITVDPATYELLEIDKDRLVMPKDDWPSGNRLVVEYLAGIVPSEYPGVVQWMLMAAGWLIEQPTLFVVADAVQAVPSAFVDSLLWPLHVPARI